MRRENLCDGFLAAHEPWGESLLIYYDQRIRKEGYDIERMMAAAGRNAIAAPVGSFAGDSMPQALESTKTEVQPG
ncbi:MAG TPA: hypothetical protein VII41_15990 [Steroidobacteraceae bacterium]